MATNMFQKKKPVYEAPTFSRAAARPEKKGDRGEKGEQGARGVQGVHGKRGPQGAPGPGGGLPNAAAHVLASYRSGEYRGSTVEDVTYITELEEALLAQNSYTATMSMNINAEGFARITLNGLYEDYTIRSTPVDLRELLPSNVDHDGLVRVTVEFFRVDDDAADT